MKNKNNKNSPANKWWISDSGDSYKIYFSVSVETYLGAVFSGFCLQWSILNCDWKHKWIWIEVCISGHSVHLESWTISKSLMAIK